MHGTDQPDSKERFVSDLHALWEQGGSPKWAAMAARCGVSKTSLNDAANRTDRLPSRRVVREFLIALGVEDHDDWLARRDDLAETAKHIAQDEARSQGVTLSVQEGTTRETIPPAEALPEPENSETAVPSQPPRRARFRWRRAAIFAAVSVALSAASLTYLTNKPSRPVAQQPQSAVNTVAGMRVFYDVPNGSDPTQTRCLEDAMNFGQSNIEGLGSLKMVHSPSCRAYWARVERVDGHTIGNSSFAAVYLKDSPGIRQEVNWDDAMVIFTPILVAEDGDRVCVEGTITVDGTVHTLEPLC